MKTKLFIVLLVSISINIYALPPETTYLGNVVYQGYYDDGSWGPNNIGFNFTFFGTTYTQFNVTSNGLIIFGSGSNDYTEDPIPSSNTPNNFISAFWDDIVIDPSGVIMYTTIGAAPNRKLIIQWTNMGFYSSTVLMGTFTAILYEGSNKIQIQYRNIVDNTSDRAHGNSASIGVENSTGTIGVQYAYHNATAVSSEKAISFTPSGPTYSLNSNDIYEGVVLTRNLSLPEPGIPTLISPANNAVVGASQKFEWTSASNATSYTLKISSNSDISSSTDYNAGTNLDYDLTGLTLNTVYYWAVFASNSTGTTWSEIKKFNTSTNPPLAGVPQTIWLELNDERDIRLQYTGGDASSKTAIITSLPAQGHLYQYNAGAKGALISTVPTTLSDPNMYVIYVADGSTGNGVGNFNFIIHDNTGDSPSALTTLNISPPGIPNFLLAAKSGDIEMQFDKPMADPVGKQNQFTVKVNGTPVTISAVGLKPGDPYTIIVTLAVPLTGSEIVLISYTQGTVTSEAGGLLPSFVDQPVTFTAQSITFSAIPVKTYGDPSFTLSATASSGLAVTYTSSNTSVASMSGNTVIINGAGTSDITAKQAGNGTYAPAKYIQQLTVNKAAASVTLSGLTSTYTGFPISATATTTPVGLTVDYTYDGSPIAPTNVGTYAVVGTISDANYQGTASGSLVISKETATVTLGSLSATYNGSPKSATATTAPVGLTVDFTYDGSATAPTNAGTYAVVGTISDANYQGTSSGSLVISKATATVTLGSLSATYNGSPKSATATTAPVGLTVDFTYDGSATAPTNAATYAVVGTISDANYQGTASGSLVISKATATLTLGSLSATYNGSPKSATATTTPVGLTVDFTYDGSATAPTNAGTYAVVGTISDANYQGTSSGSLVISKATATVTLGSLSATYNGSPKSATATTAPVGLTVDFTYDGSATAPTNAGTYAVVGTINDANYQGTSSGSLVISKATATVTLGSLSATYNGSPKSATATTAPVGLTVDFTYDGSATAPTNAGTYAVVGTISDANYQGTSSGSLVISKATATVTLGSLSATYNGSPKSATATTAPVGLTVDFTYDGSATAPTNAGTYAVVGTISDANYQGTSSGSLVISKATAMVTLGSLSATYNGSPKSATATTAPVGLTVDFTYDGSATAPTNAGTYAVVGTISDANYQGTSSGSLVISKATATVTLGSLSATYNGSPKSATATTAPVGLTVDFTYDGSATAPTNAGTYAVVGTISDANYQGTSSGSLVISKATATVTLGSLSATYNGSPKSATATTAPVGLTVDFTYDGSATAPTNAGTYAVVGTISDANYQGTSSGSLVISKATATVTLGSLSATYNGSPKSATATTAPVGLTVDFTYDGSATAPTNAGTYAVVGTINEANYQGTASGSLVISKATATVTLGSLSATYNGSPKSATATTAPVGLTVNFTYDGSATAPTNAGTYAVVGTINDANYQGTASGSLVISKATATVTLGSLSATYNGSPKSATATTAPVGLTVNFTYDGSATAPTNAGTYAVVGTISDTNYQGTSSGSLVISKATATVTLGSLSATYNGSPKSATATTAPVGLTVNFTYDGSATAPTNAGTYAVVGTISDTNYQGTSSGSLVISKATATVTLGSLSATYNGSPKSATATTAPVGLTVNFTYDGSATAPTNAGTYAVVGTISDANYQGTSSGSLVISKATATVTLGSLSATYNGSPKSATATTAPVGLTVNFTYDGSATAPTNAGTYAVVGTISDANYQGTANSSLVISKATATVNLGNLNAIYDGSELPATATTIPVGLAVELTYDGSTTAPTNAGTYAVVGTINDANYQGTASGGLVISKATATVTLGSLSAIYNGSPKSATATTAPVGLTVDFTYDGSATAPTNAGTYVVVGTINDTNYEGTSSSSLIISKATATVNLGNLNAIYDGSELPATATTIPVGLTVEFSYDGSVTAPTNAGTYVVVGTINDTNYEGTSSGSLIISKATATVNLGNLNAIYDGSELPATATTIPVGLAVELTYDGSTTAPTNAGTYAVVGTINDVNYQGTANGSLVISKATATVTLGSLNATYNGSPKSATATTAPVGLTVSFTYDGSTTAPTNAGTYAVVGTINDANYQGTSSGSLLIDKGIATISFIGLTPIYSGFPSTLTAITSPEGLVVDITYDGLPIAPINVGIYAVQGIINDANYQGLINESLIISKATQMIEFGTLPVMVIGDADYSLNAIANSGLPVSYTSDNTDVVTIVDGKLHIINSGTAIITASQSGNANYIAAPDVQQTFTVKNISQTITFEELLDKTYGDADFDPLAVASSGLIVSYFSSNSSVATIVDGKIHIISAGTTVITASQAGDSQIQAAESIDRLLTVNKALLTVSAENKTRIYNTANPDFSTVYSGFVHGENESVIDELPVIQTNALQNTPVGSYEITLQGGNDNCYEFQFVFGVMTITKAPQIINMDIIPDQILVNQPFLLNATSSSGLTVTFTSSDNTIAQISGNELVGLKDGMVVVKAIQLGNENYLPAELEMNVEIISTFSNILHLFTPNNDGFNDYWVIPELETYGRCHVIIYNRWGKKVYESSDYSNNWDGVSQGKPLPEAAYYYLIETENSGKFKGVVNIVR